MLSAVPSQILLSPIHDEASRTLEPNPRDSELVHAYLQFGMVAICVPTFRRPANLTALLKSIRALEPGGFGLHVIVVDNDAAESARPVVEDVLGGSSIPFTYDCVPEKNLPVVRNRLVERARMIAADWMWFLDDDQYVEPDALRLMLATASEYRADCVVPRVRYEFEASPSSWAQWSGIFDELPRSTGKPARRFGTNGPLCRASSVAAINVPFDPALGFVGGHHGGEDGYFFARFHAHGFRSIGCHEALVHDRFHASRNNPHWLTHRALRVGLVKGFLARDVAPSFGKSARLLFAGAGYSGLNLLLTTLMLPLGPSRFARPWIRAVQGYGVVLGVLTGRRYLRGRDPALIHGA